MNNLVNALKKDINDLDKRFNKGGRDFGKVAKEKPKVIERIINKGSDNALRCLEIAMGHELTDKEIHQRNRKSIESVEYGKSKLCTVQ